MAVASPDVAALDVGNVLLMEHLNLTVPDQLEATLFYLVGMGLTRDPYNTVGVDNMHVNVGENQFHLPTRGAQVVGGHIGLVMPDLEALEKRLQAVQPRLAHTQMAWHQEADNLAVTCPWGNQFRVYAPSERFDAMRLGVPYIEFLARPGAAAGIARFYEQVLGCPSSVQNNDGSTAAHVQMGRNQELIFRETAEDAGPYVPYHVAVYVANFSGPYTYMKEHGTLTEEIRNHQFRFQAIVDPESGETVHELEHEVRNLHHPQFRRVLVNREAP
jgi:hypothetical protein